MDGDAIDLYADRSAAQCSASRDCDREMPLESVQAEVKNPFLKRLVLYTAVGASVSTAMAEILGGGIALFMLFKLPVKIGSFRAQLLLFIFSLRMPIKN